MSENTFDLIVIGAGPGGYVAAIRAAQPASSPAPTPAAGPAADPNDGGTCRSRDECPNGQVCLMVGRADFGVCATPGF